MGIQMNSEISKGISHAYSVRTDLLVVALTGRTGSGCSTTADELCKKFSELAVSTDPLNDPEKRKKFILLRFLEKQWVPFKKITVSSVILGALAGKDERSISKYLVKLGLTKEDITAPVSIIKKIRGLSGFYDFHKCAFGTNDGDQIKAWEFYQDHLSIVANSFRSALGTSYPAVFQQIGDNLRRSGDPLSDLVAPDSLFTLMRAVKRLSKAAFKFNQNQTPLVPSTRIVIDAVRNPLELVYLRDQFAAFYSIAISSNDEDRRSRLRALKLSEEDIKSIDDKEYSEHSKTLDSYENFVSQNLQSCIQKSDIFFNNSGSPAERLNSIAKLNYQIVRYVALMLRPGLVTPTRDERCMQLAFVAKLNSGCISRQVGAAVADRGYSIKSVGWNDVAKDQTPCLLRDVGDLLSGRDTGAFSKFENTDSELHRYLEGKFSKRSNIRADLGVLCPFCFKDAYNSIKKEKNQVHTRSLHAEENAFLQLAKYGNSGIEGGVLYTTASPCELCSKKACQLGIKEIVFVDPYPGISSQHILSSGPEHTRPVLRLFSGAVGHAYHRLYESILPIKDEFDALLR